MNSKVTDLPLHEVVLQILFYENIEKAAEMTPLDVLWRIDNPEISERQVREVLDWLVLKKKVNIYLGKYSITRIEFLKQKELYQLSLNVDNSSNNFKNNKPKHKTFYITKPNLKQNKYFKYLLVLAMLMFGYLTYTFYDLKHQLKHHPELIKKQKSIINLIPNVKQLYVSNDTTYTSKEKKAINISFGRQNKINNTYVKELNKLQFLLDSISKFHKNEMIFLQNELSSSTTRLNQILNKIVIGNILILILIAFLYLKKS